MVWLRYVVVIAFIWAVSFLTYLVVKAFSFGRRNYFSLSRGNEKKGVIYALGPGLMPWAKESAAHHLGVYLAGIIYHLAILVGFIILIISLFGLVINSGIRTLMATILGAGLLSGSGLFLRRIIDPKLRFISQVDDYLANILVDAFLAFGLVFLYFSTFYHFFSFSAVILLVYTPLGKIRHCFFFFVSRIFFGRFFGRRGVLPSSSHLIKIKREVIR